MSALGCLRRVDDGVAEHGPQPADVERVEHRGLAWRRDEDHPALPDEHRQVAAPARDVIPAMQAYWRRGLAGGGFQIVSYGIVLWAMTLAPIAIVATLRETSVLFGAVIAVVVLKEPLRAIRVVAALLIVCGLVLIRLQ